MTRGSLMDKIQRGTGSIPVLSYGAVSLVVRAQRDEGFRSPFHNGLPYKTALILRDIIYDMLVERQEIRAVLYGMLHLKRKHPFEKDCSSKRR